jgi:geranylgeranyl diphosphate synthase type II
MIDSSRYFRELLPLIDELTADLKIKKEPNSLYDPINYLFLQKGKRIRAILVLLSNQLFHDNIIGLKEIVLGIESLHNFTLIHDDVMDNAVLRRGATTINKKWSTNQAILSGDVLMIHAYKHLLLSKEINRLFLQKFTDTAIEICEGQQLDLDMQSNNILVLDDYYRIINGKTGSLIKLSLTAPCYLTDSALKHLNTMNSIGLYVGQLFQVQDDYLDLYGEEDKVGKLKGGDVFENKKTFLYAVALSSASPMQKKKLISIYHSNNSNKLEEVISLYNQLSVKEIVQKEIDKLSSKIFKLINSLDVKESKKELFVEFIKLLLIRKS